MPGRTLRGEESEEEEYGERLWLDIVFEKLSFLLLFTAASLLCYCCWQIGWKRVGGENRGDGQDSVGEAIIGSVSRRLARCSKFGS